MAITVPAPTPGDFTIDDQIAYVKTIRDKYYVALLLDAANPQPSYSFEGQSIDRDGWREKMRAALINYNEILGMLQPFEITTVQM